MFDPDAFESADAESANFVNLLRASTRSVQERLEIR
jgi:hypothetical protein